MLKLVTNHRSPFLLQHLLLARAESEDLDLNTWIRLMTSILRFKQAHGCFWRPAYDTRLRYERV